MDYYESVSGVRMNIRKPKDLKYLNNRVMVPAEIGLNYPKPNVPLMINSEEFIKHEPKDFKVDNCSLIWNNFRGNLQELRALSENKVQSIF